MRKAGLGTEKTIIPTDQANNLSSRYGPKEDLEQSAPERTPIFAHHTQRNCFVMLRLIDGDTSSFHLEGKGKDIRLQSKTLLEVAEDYARQLEKAFQGGVNTRGQLMDIRLYEDSGNEVGVEGRLVDRKAVFRATVLDELRGKIVASLTTGVLVYFQMEERSAWAASWVTVGMFLLLALVEFGFKTAWEKGKIKFEVRR